MARTYSGWQLGIDFDRASERAETWTKDATELVETYCRFNLGPFSILDVETVLGPPPGSGNAAGALFGRLARQGVIVPCGRVRVTRPEAHRRTVTQWRAA